MAPSLHISTGTKDSAVIVMINKDADDPVVSMADYGLAADLFVTAPELVAAPEVARVSLLK